MLLLLKVQGDHKRELFLGVGSGFVKTPKNKDPVSPGLIAVRLNASKGGREKKKKKKKKRTGANPMKISCGGNLQEDGTGHHLTRPHGLVPGKEVG